MPVWPDRWFGSSIMPFSSQPSAGSSRMSRAGLRRFLVGKFAVLLAVTVAVAAEAAGSYEFLAAPEIDLNRVYRLDRATGEIGACQYALKEGTVGVTWCYPPGEGAGPQGLSEYSLVASRHEREGGVFR